MLLSYAPALIEKEQSGGAERTAGMVNGRGPANGERSVELPKDPSWKRRSSRAAEISSLTLTRRAKSFPRLQHESRPANFADGLR